MGSWGELFKHQLNRTWKLAISSCTTLTVSTQIERILYSQHLTATSFDTNGFEVFTPRHFLIGRHLTLLVNVIIICHLVKYQTKWSNLNGAIGN